jgi:hypothetical protein
MKNLSQENRPPDQNFIRDPRNMKQECQIPNPDVPSQYVLASVQTVSYQVGRRSASYHFISRFQLHIKVKLSHPLVGCDGPITHQAALLSQETMEPSAGGQRDRPPSSLFLSSVQRFCFRTRGYSTSWASVMGPHVRHFMF